MRPFCLYTVLFFLGACSSLDWALSDKNYDATRQNPQWIKHSAQSFNTAVAEIRQRQLHIYDKSVFKFNRINKLRKSEAPVLIKTPKTLPGSGLHLIINNQAASTVKQAIPKLSLSRIERMYHNSMGLSGGKGITQAGYQELKNSSSAKTAAVFPGYFLGPGDKLKVNITGSLNYGKTLTVDEKGFVFLPKGIGALRVFDKTVAELDDIFYDAIEREYKNFKVSVSLAEVRNIRILLSGKVVSPGLKQLPANASLLDALALAGGITKDGSLRQVSLHRKNGSVINLDLYQLFFKGDQNLDLLLRSGDHLIVPPIGPTICLSGDSNTGIYEVGKSQLQDLFNMHGKLNAFTSRQRIFFEKTVDGKRREIYSLPFDKLQKIQLQDGYVFEFQNVRNQLDNTVQLLGEVTRPGTYPWKSGMMLSGLLKRGEGFLLNASLHMALIKRRSQGEVLYKRQGSKGIIRVRDQLLWIPLDQVIAGKYDIPLQRLDRLQIMSLADWQDKAQIEVIGAVRKSGKFDLTQNMTLGDAIKLAGQTSANAFPGEGVIIRCIYNKVNRHFDVKMYHFDVMNLLNNGRSALITLEDADRIIIRSASSKNVQISIEGAVQFPGTYVLPAGAKITTLISAAGGLLENADLRAADYRRESVKIQQQKHLQRLFELTRQRLSRTRSHLTKDGQIREGYAGTMEMMGLGQLKNEMVQNQSNGRVVLDFLQDDFPESLDNLLLENQDKLIIPQKMSSVMIIGHVFSPSAFVWRLQLSVEDYLRMSGGYREEAGAEEVYLVMASGEVRAARQIGHSKLMDFIPGPGDSIVVPKQELKRSTMAQTSDYLSLFKQMAEVGILAKGIPGRSDISASIESTQREQSSSLSSYDHLLNKK